MDKIDITDGHELNDEELAKVSGGEGIIAEKAGHCYYSARKYMEQVIKKEYCQFSIFNFKFNLGKKHEPIKSDGLTIICQRCKKMWTTTDRVNNECPPLDRPWFQIY